MSNELIGNNATRKVSSIKNFSLIGIFTCLATLVLAFIFKDDFIYVLSYLEQKSNSNIVQFHILLIILFTFVSLPILWGYTICTLICAYVYSFFYGFLLVMLYSAIGMTISFYVCRYVFYDCAHQRVKSINYLQAISSIIESNDKGFKIIILSRLMPLPFGLVNTLFSVMDIHYKSYIINSLIGLAPTQLVLCYMGSTLKSMSDVLANQSTAKTASVVFLFQLIVSVGVLMYILTAAKHELEKHIEETKNLKNESQKELYNNFIRVTDTSETDNLMNSNVQL